MQSHQSVLKGIGIINQKFISKTDFFYKLKRRGNSAFLLFAVKQCNMKYTCLNPDAGKALILAPTAQGRYVMIHKVNRTTL